MATRTNTNLSTGCINSIYHTGIFKSTPIVQILNANKLPNNNFGVIVSDGVNCMPAVLSMAITDTVKSYTIIKLKNFVRRYRNDRFEIDIMEYTVGPSLDRIVGVPKVITEKKLRNDRNIGNCGIYQVLLSI